MLYSFAVTSQAQISWPDLRIYSKFDPTQTSRFIAEINSKHHAIMFKNDWKTFQAELDEKITFFQMSQNLTFSHTGTCKISQNSTRLKHPVFLLKST